MVSLLRNKHQQKPMQGLIESLERLRRGRQTLAAQAQCCYVTADAGSVRHESP
ncbi:MAG: hypothetical protein WEA31_06345 [Pirellulales bacterium]